MESEVKQETFGSYLKGFRRKQELTIETVARTTKIAVHCLNAIEQDAHDHLPPRAYVKSFIRTYARAVGANADVAVDLYLSDLTWKENIKKQNRRKRAKLYVVRRSLMVVGVITSILLLARYTDIFNHPTPTDTVETPTNTAPFQPSATQRQSDVSTPPTPATTTPEPLRLQIHAVEKTWLKVIVDGQNHRSYDLKPEDRLELEGTDNFNLMIGNATGLKILLNDRPVKIFGSSGQVVSLKIP